MKSNEQIELTGQMGTDSWMESRVTVVESGEGLEGLSEKEKVLMGIQNSGVITGWRQYKGTK